MATVHAGAPAPSTVRGTPAARRALRTEKAQLARWRRLLRARLDLAVVGFAPPEPLGVALGDELPASRYDIPTALELSHAITVAPPLDPIELMTCLRRLDRALAAYEKDVDLALEETTVQVVRELAAGGDLPVTRRSPGVDGR